MAAIRDARTSDFFISGFLFRSETFPENAALP
jgi:hypothetical protein